MGVESDSMGTATKPRIVLVGCGSIAAQHAKRLKEKAELYFFSRSRERAQQYAARFSGSLAESRLDDVLANPRYDGLILCTPPDQHLAFIEAGVAAKKTMLIEKPLCVSAEELESLEALLQRNPQARIMVAENYYYKPITQYVRKQIREGHLGEIHRLLLKKEFTQIDRGTAAEWKSEFGALLEGGIHFVAQMNDMIEASSVATPLVKARFGNESPERTSMVTWEGPSRNFLATLRYSWKTPALLKGLLQHSVVEGSLGKIVFESNGLYALTRLKHQPPKLHFFLKDAVGFNTMLADFLNFVQGGESPFSNAHRAFRDLRCIFTAYQSAERSDRGQAVS